MLDGEISLVCTGGADNGILSEVQVKEIKRVKLAGDGAPEWTKLIWAVFAGQNPFAKLMSLSEACCQNKRRLVPQEEYWNMVKGGKRVKRAFSDIAPLW